MKILNLFLCLFIVNSSFSQENYLSVNIKNKESKGAIKNTYVIENQKNKSLFVFLEERKTTYAFKFDSNKNLESEFISEGIKNINNEVIGNAFDDNRVMLLRADKNYKKYSGIIYDFNNSTSKELKYKLKMNGEKYLQSYSHEDKCYVFTLNTTSLKIKKWILFIDGTFKTEEIEFNKPLNSNNFKFLEEMVKVDNTLPNGLEIASEKYKMYEHENGFLWTFDYEKAFTVLIDFSLPDLTHTIKLIEKPKIEGVSPKTNSFIIEHKIAQIVSNKQSLKIEIKNLQNLTQLKTLEVKKKDTIQFKNTPILQEGTQFKLGSLVEFDSTREMEKTSKFLRKISSGKNGISMYKTSNGYRVTIGGFENDDFTPMMLLAAVGNVQIAQFGSISLSFNSAPFAYGSYGMLKSTRIECMFDDSFNHIKGELDENIFDKIDKHKERLVNFPAHNVFHLGDKLLFGFYHEAINTYELLSFN